MENREAPPELQPREGRILRLVAPYTDEDLDQLQGRHNSGVDKDPDWRTKVWVEPPKDYVAARGRHELDLTPTARQRLGELLVHLEQAEA